MNENSNVTYDLLEKIQVGKPKEERRTYEFYGFSKNPFPKAGIAPDEPTVFEFDSKSFNAIMDTISDSYINNQFGGTVILGEYGMGKTHTLRYIAHLVNGQLGNLPDEAAIAIYLKNPRSSMAEMVSGLYNGIGKERLRHLIKAPMLANKELEEKIVRGDLIKNVHQVLYETIGDYDTALLLAIFGFGDQPDCDYAWDAIMGAVRKGLPKVKEIRPEQFINSFFILLRSRGFRHVYVLVDEFEDLPGSALTKTKKREYAVGLRDLIDKNTEGFSLIVASNATPWEVVKELLPPLVNRFGLTIRLDNLTEEDTYKLIAAYLRAARKVEQSDPSLPFTKDGVILINKQEAGVRRFILQRCYELIEQGIMNSWTQIGEDEARSVPPKNVELAE